MSSKPEPPDVTAFLRWLAENPYGWDDVNCGTSLGFCVQWARASNRNPADEWIDTGEAGPAVMARLRAAGGLPVVVAREARALGLPRVTGPDFPVGCIAVVRYGRKGGDVMHHGAIRADGGWWALKCNRRVLLTRRVRVVAAWSVR